MNKFNGQESFIHSSESNKYHIRQELVFIENPDAYRSFLLNFYRVVISAERWPQDKLTLLHSGFEQILFTLDAAWLFYEQHLNIQEKLKDVTPEGNPLEPSFTDYSLDEYYPYLQENKWPAERQQRFRGRIQLLNQPEIASGSLFYQQFFDYQSQGDWKRHVSLWLEAALDDRPIFSSRDFSPAQIFEHYQLLLKLTERVWLDDRQDRHLLYHEIMPWFDINNYPVFGTMDFCLNPYREIFGFFHSRSLMDYKKQLDRSMKLALNADEVQKETPAELLNQLRTLVTMADCLWLIWQLGPTYPKTWNKSNTFFSGKHAAIPKPGYKYLLCDELVRSPENYLPIFFHKYTLNQVFLLFFESTLATMDSVSSPASSPREINEFHADFLLLLEAAFLIQAKKYAAENESEK